MHLKLLCQLLFVSACRPSIKVAAYFTRIYRAAYTDYFQRYISYCYSLQMYSKSMLKVKVLKYKDSAQTDLSLIDCFYYFTLGYVEKLTYNTRKTFFLYKIHQFYLNNITISFVSVFIFGAIIFNKNTLKVTTAFCGS